MTTWKPGWDAVPEPIERFFGEYHLATLTTLRADGRPHVVPVGVTLDVEQRCAWVITFPESRKARNLLERPGSPVAACHVDGGRWLTVEGTASVTSDPQQVARAVERYAARYRQPKERPDRVALRIEVERVLHGAHL
ncbi:TIGR03618 family F420-dependent PPOX class oxidoreductase [Nocardioides sp. ChNu-153]|uniref:pyridoxamine 5'-phosphate oxidase family protein n=1 Tax=unclassified Nocardioides TaxID=2615069 RepID=UPI002404E7AD|nr:MULTISPECIES: TIGR03618 family F420-dependent PPOX class oxidoreductase [unclassified Nocardioides]MDF9715064.1 TIGR03618 family F420-dependent PPOX class oxidoreductase [Nocardioides sp. ChNu-99]MDN7122333.1 TIGR03618 family F420-dependent PPOX class oxidoreductase [Nocardioides sp. ChNu-153]